MLTAPETVYEAECEMEHVREHFFLILSFHLWKKI